MKYITSTQHKIADRPISAAIILLLAGTLLLIIGCAGASSQPPVSQQPVSQQSVGQQPEPGLSAPVTAHAATLSWDPSTTVGVGYRVYRSTQSGDSYALLNSAPVSTTSFTDSTVENGETYFYVVTAVDADFNESGYSNEVFATIPSS